MPKSSPHKDLYSLPNPIDFIEETVISEDWPFQRISSDEIFLEIPGRWGDYRLQFLWQHDAKILQIYCALDMRIQPKNLPTLYELLAILNDQLPLGHFEISIDEAMPTYRYNFLLPHIKNLTSDYLEDLIDIAIYECERFYPAFQLSIWGGKSAKEAASIAMIETLGEA